MGRRQRRASYSCSYGSSQPNAFKPSFDIATSKGQTAVLSTAPAAPPATPAAAVTFLLEFALAEAEDLIAFAKAVPTATSRREHINQGQCGTCGQRLPSLSSPQPVYLHHSDMLTPVSSSKPVGAAQVHSRRSTGEVLQQLQESKERAAAMSAATAALNGIATATYTALTPRRMSTPGASASTYLPALLSARGKSMSPRPAFMGVPSLQGSMAELAATSASISRPAEPSFRAQLTGSAEECPTPKLGCGQTVLQTSRPLAAPKPAVPKLALPARRSSDLLDVRDQASKA